MGPRDGGLTEDPWSCPLLPKEAGGAIGLSEPPGSESEARNWVLVKFSHKTLALFLGAWASRPRSRVGQDWGATSCGGLTLTFYPLPIQAELGWGGWVFLLGIPAGHAFPYSLPHPTPLGLDPALEPLVGRVLMQGGVLL